MFAPFSAHHGSVSPIRGVLLRRMSHRTRVCCIAGGVRAMRICCLRCDSDRVMLVFLQAQCALMLHGLCRKPTCLRRFDHVFCAPRICFTDTRRFAAPCVLHTVNELP